MITKWYSSTAIELAKMIDVTDELIREKSSGQVTKDYLVEDENEDVKEVEDKTGTVIDPAIFGDYTEKDIERLGHIELPIPVVNIQYVRGRRPELPRLLGMSLNDFERIMYYASFINANDDWTNGTILYTSAERDEYLANNVNAKGEDFLVGGDAIIKLIEAKGLPVNKYILHTVPVMPLCMRFTTYTNSNGEKVRRMMSLNTPTNSVLLRANRLERLVELDAPEIIILNEKRLLQERVDSYISNGLRGCQFTAQDELPVDSLNELYDHVTANNTHIKLDEDAYKDCVFSDIQKKVIDKQHESDLIDEKYKKMFREREEAGEDPNEMDPIVMDNEDVDKQNEINAEMHELLRPMREKILETSFPQYEVNADNKMLDYISDKVERGILSSWKPEDGPLFQNLLRPLFENFRLYFEKQYCFEE